MSFPFLLSIYQCDIALVGFRLLVQQGEDAVGACQAHDDHVHLVGHLADGAGKLLCHVQERHHNADAERHAGDADVGCAGQQQSAAYQGHHNVHDVADVTQQRHQNVGKAVAVAGIEKDLAVYLIKIRLGAILMAEHLDDLLTGHHLLHKGFGIGDGDLLAQEIFGGTAGDGPSCDGHADDACNHQQRENDAVIHHNSRTRRAA